MEMTPRLTTAASFVAKIAAGRSRVLPLSNEVPGSWQTAVAVVTGSDSGIGRPIPRALVGPFLCAQRAARATVGPRGSFVVDGGLLLTAAVRNRS
jgi:hypothetical protein